MPMKWLEHFCGEEGIKTHHLLKSRGKKSKIKQVSIRTARVRASIVYASFGEISLKNKKV